MASKHQLTGMTGVYLVAAELSKRGLTASPTSRSAQGADLLVTDQQCQRSFAIQVKTNAKSFGFWLVGPNAQSVVSDSLIYAFVNLRKIEVEYYLIPSKIVAKNVVVTLPSPTRKTTWYSVYKRDIGKYRDNWSVFDSDVKRRANPPPAFVPKKKLARP
jgi:hypothetical protein